MPGKIVQRLANSIYLLFVLAAYFFAISLIMVQTEEHSETAQAVAIAVGLLAWGMTVTAGWSLRYMISGATSVIPLTEEWRRANL